MQNLFKDINQIGRRLRLARQGACLSTRQVQDILKAHSISISHATIGNYERGITKPSEDILTELAKIYGRDLEWIRGTGLTLEPIRYRALRSVSVSEKNQFKSQAESWLNLYLYVENLLNHKLKRNAQAGFVVKSGESGQELAERMRLELKFETHPIPSTIRILEDFGIYTIQVRSEARIDAFVGSFDDSRAVVLNSTLSNDRIRLDAMHELAHFLYDDGPSLSPDEVETRAFEFASHMLLPESQLREAFQLKSMVRLIDYKERFGISLAAMIFRARKSKIISKQLYQRIWASFSQFGYRKDEPGRVSCDRPLRMEALIDGAIANGLTSYENLARIASTESSVVEKRVMNAMNMTKSDLSSDKSDSKTLNFDEFRSKLNKEYL